MLVLISIGILYLTIGYFFYILSKKDKIITKKNEELEILATHDPLTHTHNRLMFDRHLHTLIDKQNPFILTLFDIDFFKVINDQHGHDIGDKVLQELVIEVQNSLRREDILFRIGGKEFAIVFDKIQLEPALNIIERIRMHIQDKVFVNNIHLTISFGVAQYSTQNLSQLFKDADIALYQAKKGGRNQVVLYQAT
ncbi:MAG: GGDEF domain-containing protein [Campylobacterales bacterium]|nr:GGDEF domain-containing protein [Campylobacterales bacterium]